MGKAKEMAVELCRDVTDGLVFQELWERIRRRTRFEADADSEKLIADAVEGIMGISKVEQPEVLSIRADLSVERYRYRCDCHLNANH